MFVRCGAPDELIADSGLWTKRMGNCETPAFWEPCKVWVIKGACVLRWWSSSCIITTIVYWIPLCAGPWAERFIYIISFALYYSLRDAGFLPVLQRRSLKPVAVKRCIGLRSSRLYSGPSFTESTSRDCSSKALSLLTQDARTATFMKKVRKPRVMGLWGSFPQAKMRGGN